jgi:hypothetical protein
MANTNTCAGCIMYDNDGKSSAQLASCLVHKVAKESTFTCPLWCGAAWGWQNALITYSNMILKAAQLADGRAMFEWQDEHAMIKQLEARLIARRHVADEGRKAAAKAEAE